MHGLQCSTGTARSLRSSAFRCHANKGVFTGLSARKVPVTVNAVYTAPGRLHYKPAAPAPRGAKVAPLPGEEARRLEAALKRGLAREAEQDPLGAACAVEVTVLGAPCAATAAGVAAGVAGSAAVRAALRACTADCGPIIAAVSRSGVEVPPHSLHISIGGMSLVHHGRPAPLAASGAAYVCEYLHAQIAGHGKVVLEVEIGAGPGKATACGTAASMSNMDGPK